MPLRDADHDRLIFMLSGHARYTIGGKTYPLEGEDAARAERGAEARLEAIDEVKFVEAQVPALTSH